MPLCEHLISPKQLLHFTHFVLEPSFSSCSALHHFKTVVIWDVILCNLVYGCQRFGGKCLHLQSRRWRQQVSLKWTTLLPGTWRYNLEDCSSNILCFEIPIYCQHHLLRSKQCECNLRFSKQ
jgi:hypothetical protein